jgi:hypothetical protein
MCDLYATLKDFAGPVATIIAATAAAVITWRFQTIQARLGRRQAAIARAQARTATEQARTSKLQAELATDRLRYDVFKLRYAVYEALKDLLRDTINRAHDPDYGPSDIVPKLVVLDEAPFFFSEEKCALIRELVETAERVWLFYVAERDILKVMQHRGITVDTMLADQKRLVAAHRDMAKLFKDEFSFRQLTGD